MRYKLHLVLILTLSLVWLILPHAVALGATYYVSVTGSGSHDGSIAANAFSLIEAQSYANNNPNEEITFLLASGTYGEFSLTNSPERIKDAWITWKAQGEVVFERIYISNSSKRNAYMKFDGINVQHSNPGIPCNDPDDPTIGECGGKWCTDHPNAPGYLAHIKNANYVELLNGTYRGYGKYISKNIAIGDSDNVTISNCEISNTMDGVTVSYDCQNFVFRNNHIHHLSQGSTVRLLGNAYERFGTIIENNHIHDQRIDINEELGDDACYFPWHALGTSAVHAGSGISLRISNVTIRNNIIREVFPQSIMFYGGYVYHNMTIENNLFFDSGRVALYNCGNNILIRNNTFVGSIAVDGTKKHYIRQRYAGGAPGVHIAEDYDGSSIEVYNNIFVGNWSPGDTFKENNNISWTRGAGDYSQGLGDQTFIALWIGGAPSYELHGYPNYFEDIGFRGTTPEYDYSRDGIQPFFINPGFYTGDVGNHQDSGKIWDYHLADGSLGINFGDPNNQPSDSLGSIGPDGFIRDDGLPRDLSHHSAGCYEYISTGPQPPITDAGDDQTVTDTDGNGSEEVTFDGSASFDPDGEIVSYVWSEDGLQIATGINPTVTLSTGEHLITLTVTDDGGLTDTDTVTVKVLKEDKEFGKLPTGCYNNVFNPTKGERALIIVNLPKQARVKLGVYDTRGNKIRELADGERDAGTWRYPWDGRNDSGNVVGSGLYFVHMEAGDYKKTKKIVVVK